MYCNKCGSICPDGTPYCANCGAAMGQAKESINIVEATKLFFTRYTDFNGRSRRSEYWWASLTIGIIGAIVTGILGDLAWIWSLATLIPSLAISVRRLHDIGKSGWWYLINLIPLAGQILFLIWACQDSTEDNQWGPNPKY